MVIAPSKKKTISLTSADALVNSVTAISVEGAYTTNILCHGKRIKLIISEEINDAIKAKPVPRCTEIQMESFD